MHGEKIHAYGMHKIEGFRPQCRVDKQLVKPTSTTPSRPCRLAGILQPTKFKTINYIQTYYQKCLASVLPLLKKI